MSSNDSTINLDDSSILSSTKNSSVLEVSNNVIDIASSDDDDVGNSVSENVDSASENLDNRNVEICSSDEEVSENYITSVQSPFQVTLKPDINLNTSSDQSSVVSASQLLSGDTSSFFNINNATRVTDDSTVAELTAELANHKMKLSEEVVEGFGHKIEEIGEIIEDTFKDKKIASTFGDNENEVNEVASACLKLSLNEENVTVEGVVVDSSPNKRKVDLAAKLCLGDLSSGEVTDVEDNINTIDAPGLPAKRQKIAEPDLPKTCQVLVSASSGAKVYLIGTAHFSKESCEDVSLVIQGVQPDIVMVELCKARTNILHLDEETILEEAQNLDFEKSLEIIRSQGTVQGVMYLLLLSMSAHLTKELGMAPGGEFRRAFTEAKKVPGCMVHLGDRPINITLKRALAALSPWQKLRLGWNILTSRDSITKEEVEKCKDRDLLENMLAEMAGEFPALSRVFVAERDLFLAHSLQMAADAIPVHALGPDGQKLEGFNPPTVVGVVGIGHMPGIIEHWGKVTREQVRDVVRVDPPSVVSKVVRFTVKTAFWGGCLYGVYRLCRGPVNRLLIVR
eukprot:GFUD01039961.1.p1 GENE.GFUD01039961.1~~GFUD01039961.1.p1  ORF type:complete len:567 (+),score=187.86 GFUD01039961.1:84-1784(+)